MSAPAFWPNADDYRLAVQNLRDSVEDEELRAGQPSLNARGKALLWAGNFAAVFRIECPQTGNTWALKCFTRPVVGQRDRYREIAEELQRARLPFTVDFRYLEQGVRAGGQWFAALKMRWVEGLTLNRFVEASLAKPAMLVQLLDWWPRLAARLREAGIAHADLQHGNVLLVPLSNDRLAIKLIDYDGMYVPTLAGKNSGEVGHPAYQHPQRLREGTYNVDVDRFSHLAIYTSIRCLIGGHRELWQQFNNDDNLLFAEADFAAPSQSPLFRTLWQSADQEVRFLVGRLALACKQPLEEVPWVDQVVRNGQVKALTDAEQQAAESLMVAGNVATRLRVPASGTATAEDDFSIGPITDETTRTDTRPILTEGTVAATPRPGSRFRAVGNWLLGSPAAAVRGLDGFLRRLVGQENRFLRYFLWAVIPLLLLVAVWAGIWALTRSPAPGKLHPVAPQIVEAGSDLKSQIVIDLGGGVKLEMVLIPAGEFLMGSPDSDKGAGNDESPRHRVRITKPFYLGKYLVTQEQWEQVMGNNPSRFKGPKNPVEMVSWEDCQVFLGKLNAKSGGQGGNFVLPTEAQWEYACRAGSTAKYCFGDDETQLGEYAWYAANSGNTTHPVGEKKPNAWGLYDMQGNLWEWCQDWMGGNYYAISPADDPTGPATGTNRMDRGGSWSQPDTTCRSAYRGSSVPAGYGNSRGFRVSLVPGKTVAGATLLESAAAIKIQPIPPQIVRAGKPLSVAVAVEDAQRWQGKLRYGLASHALPGARIDPQTGEFSWTPPPDQAPGKYDVTVSVQGPDGQVAQTTLAVMVTRPIPAPAKSWDKEIAVDLGNGVNLEMVPIPAGEFLMGSPASDDDARSEEEPQQRVRITKPFYLGKYPVTQEQWQAVMDNTPSYFKGPKNPVEHVSWDDCQQFLEKLNAKLGLAGREFQLPTEAQWEYSCRGGGTTRYCFGNEGPGLGEYASYDANSNGKTHPVREKNPNAWGLYDMHGNVWEWCRDWFDGGYYANSPTDDPTGPARGSSRVGRGGSWNSPAGYCRSASRIGDAPAHRDSDLGFRVSLVPADK